MKVYVVAQFAHKEYLKSICKCTVMLAEKAFHFLHLRIIFAVEVSRWRILVQNLQFVDGMLNLSDLL